MQKAFKRLREAQKAAAKKEKKEEAGGTETKKAQTKVIESYLDEVHGIITELLDSHPGNPGLHYNMACILTIQGRKQLALKQIEKAVDVGWWNFVHARRDPDLKALRKNEKFKKLIAQMENVTLRAQPTIPFRNSFGFAKGGEIVNPQMGVRYLISTMLAHVSKKTNTLNESLRCLRRSVQADGSRPEGTIYFMRNRDIRSITREWAFRSVVRHLEKIGVNAEIEESVLPKNRSDVMGAMVGKAKFNWEKSGSKILPGAICEHLTSAGGVMSGSGQTLLSAWISAGASGTCGTVTEPFAVQAKFPSPFIHLHYARGASLGEAFYQSVQGPYQLLIVGDPLCQPWARFPKVKIGGVSPGDTVQGEIEIIPAAETHEKLKLQQFELFIDGMRRAACKPGHVFNLDTTGFADGYHEWQVVAVAGQLHTQGRKTVPVTINNGGHLIKITKKPEGNIESGQTVQIGAELKDAAELRVVQNARLVGTIEGNQGTVEISSDKLGNGPVQLRVIGQIKSKKPPKALSAPIDFTVVEN
ncbi:MAG: TPR end-of-group domain-containing protein [Candidatus Brocadiia bacterium]